MATITVRNLDDSTYERLKLLARANHRSLEAEVRAQLDGSRASRSQLLDQMRAARLDPGPGYEGSVAAIRAIRDEE